VILKFRYFSAAIIDNIDRKCELDASNAFVGSTSSLLQQQTETCNPNIKSYWSSLAVDHDLSTVSPYVDDIMGGQEIEKLTLCHRFVTHDVR